MSKSKFINSWLNRLRRPLVKLGLVKHKIIFDAPAPFHYQHIRPVVQQVIGDDACTAWLICPAEHLAAYQDEGLKVLSYDDIERRRPFVVTDAFVTTELSHSFWWMASVKRIFLSHGTSPKLNYATSNLDLFDALTAPGPVIYEAQVKIAPATAEIIPAGLPITDQLTRLEKTTLPGTEKATLLYAPTWDINADAISISEDLLAAMSKLDNYHVIVRPHPNLLAPERCAGTDWKSIILKYAHDHFVLTDSTEISTYELMKQADLLISDTSSVAFEFALTDRPILVKSNPRFFAVNGSDDQHSILADAATEFDSANDLQYAVEKAFEENQSKLAGRTRLRERYFFNIGEATGAVVAALYKAAGIKTIG